MLADRGYSTAAGFDHVVSAGGHVTVGVNRGSLSFRTTDVAPFDLLAHVTTLKRRGKRPQPRTLEFARSVIVVTPFPEAGFTAAEVLEWSRTRWQVELVFKRFKSLAQLGPLPKYDDESAKAWLYRKLLVALLVEKLIHHATAGFPWGYRVEAIPTAQPLA